MAFKSGQSGNPAGRPKSQDKLFKEALQLAVKRTEGRKTKLALIAEALVDKAVGGDVPAINAVADRLDGKPTQVIAGDQESPLTVMLEAGKTLDEKLERLIGRKSDSA